MSANPPTDAGSRSIRTVPIEDTTDHEIVDALEKLISDAITPGAYVILEGGSDRNYYIQFALQGDRLFCEAVSNEYLDPEHELSEEQLRTLENLGWREPEYKGQNWFRTFRPTQPADYVEIVRLVRSAFTDVYGLPPDVPLLMFRSWDGQVLAPETEIRFASEGHRSTYERVVSYAAELYGEALQLDHRRPLMFVQHGSAITSVAVNPIDIHSSVLDFYSLIVRELETTPELMHWLLSANYRLRLGALSLDGEGDVVLRHSVMGDAVTRDELQILLRVLVELADQMDDEITRRFGGYTARDWAHR